MQFNRSPDTDLQLQEAVSPQVTNNLSSHHPLLIKA